MSELLNAENARDHWLKQWELKRDEAFEIRKQRDTLLAALKDVIKENPEAIGMSEVKRRVDYARQVIAAVESGKVPS